jgi:hypothetical protein
LFFRIGLLHDNICEVKEMFVGYQLILLSWVRWNIKFMHKKQL